MRRLVVLVLLLGAAHPAGAQAAGKVRPPQRAGLRGLAAARFDVGLLAHAKTAAKRQAAVRQLLGRVRLPVVDGRTGRRVGAGRIRAVDDLYAYTEEVTVVAAELAARTRTSYDALAALIDATDPDGDPATQPTGATLAALVRKGVAGAVKAPKASSSTIGLELRLLGQRHGDDPLQAGATARATLDPLQAMLITASVVAPKLRPGSGGATHSSLPQIPVDPDPEPDVARAHAASSPCQSPDAAGGLASAFSGLKTLGGSIPGLGLLVAGLDAWHGTSIATSIAVTPEDQGSTDLAFGTGGFESALVHRFQVSVVQTADVAQETIDCAWMAGYTLPAAGPVSGVKVGWTQTTYLSPLGKVLCPPATCQTTGSDGLATFSYRPDDEYLAGLGQLRTFTPPKPLHAAVYLGQALNNGSQAAAEGLFKLSKAVEFPYQVQWHQPRGYRVDVPDFTVTRPCDESGQSCTYTYQHLGDKQCLAQYDGAGSHPTRPRPYLGAPGASFGTPGTEQGTVVDAMGSSSDLLSTFTLAAGFPGPQTTRDWGENGGIQTGVWRHDQPDVTLDVAFKDQTASPGEVLFPGLAVTEATNCPELPPYTSPGVGG